MLSEQMKIVKGLAPAADRFNTDPSTDVINLEGADKVTFLVYHAGGTTGKATITVEECSSAAGSNANAIAFRYRKLTTGASDAIGAITNAAATGVSTVAGETTIFEVEVKASELADGYNFARLVLTEGADDPVSGAVIALLSGLRYGGVSQPSALA